MPKEQNRQAEKAVDNQRPFLGLRSFEEKNKSQFGGRDNEINELFGLIENSTLTIVFGKSGIGKTSLLRAGLIPELRQNFYFPIYIRIDYASTRTPLEQVRKIAYEEMKGKDPGIPEIGDSTLWEYFHNVDLLDNLVTPVIILDQFEEIFTLGEGKKNVPELLIQLADLAENRIPLKVQGEYQKSNKTVPTHYAEHPYRVIFSLREDYLARLEELKKYMPSIMNSRFRVVQMSVGQALEAAVKPGKGLIDKKVALDIIKKLPGINLDDLDLSGLKRGNTTKLKVEPFLLSLICDRINEKRIEKGLDKITSDLVAEFNVTDVINSFYEETIFKYGEKVEKAIENRLLTDGGFRKLQALEEFQRKYEITDEIIDQLVDARILRKEIRDGVDYIELIHDVLAPVIKKKRNKRARLELERKRERAIIIAKKKQRAKLIRISSIIGLALCLVLAFTSYLAYNNAKEKRKVVERNKKMALARDLIVTSKIVGSVDLDSRKSALIARLSYLIFKESKDVTAGENMYNGHFYNAMYEALKNNGYYFFINKFETGVQSMIHVNENEIVVGLKDSTLRITEIDSGKDTILFKSSKGIISSIDIYGESGKNLLAIAGTFDSIYIFDLHSHLNIKKIEIPNSNKENKFISFRNNGGLVLRQTSSVISWDSNFVNSLKSNHLKDSTISSIAFDSSTETFVAGNYRGEVYLVSNKGNESENHLSHTSVVTNIDISSNGNWIATASKDKTIVIWNRETWHSLQLTTEALNTSHGMVYSISFAPKGDFIYTGYEDGTILRWPISLEVLQKLICDTVEGSLNDEEWKIYASELIKDKDKYNCVE